MSYAAAIAAIAIIIVAGVLLFGFLPELGGGFFAYSRADINEVLSVYEYIFPDADSTCETAGGQWHDENDWWGCEGAGPANATTACHNDLADIVEQQCKGMSAEWKCDADDIYCRY